MNILAEKFVERFKIQQRQLSKHVVSFSLGFVNPADNPTGEGCLFNLKLFLISELSDCIICNRKRSSLLQDIIV